MIHKISRPRIIIINNDDSSNTVNTVCSIRENQTFVKRFRSPSRLSELFRRKCRLVVNYYYRQTLKNKIRVETHNTFPLDHLVCSVLLNILEMLLLLLIFFFFRQLSRFSKTHVFPVEKFMTTVQIQSGLKFKVKLSINCFPLFFQRSSIVCTQII